MTTEEKQPEERRRILIAEATMKDVRAFAEIDMGVKCVNGDNKPSIMAKLTEAGWANDWILLQDPVITAPVMPAPQQGQAAKGAAPEEVAEPMVKLIITEEASAGGKRPVFVGVNGVGMLIPRKQEVSVKLRYANALRAALQTTFPLNEQTQTPEPVDSPSVPYQITSWPSDDLVAKWVKWEAYCESLEHIALPKRERAA